MGCLMKRNHIGLAGLLVSLAAAPAALHAQQIDPTLPWSERMADSIIARQPKALLIENKDGGSAKWSYSTAFCVQTDQCPSSPPTNRRSTTAPFSRKQYGVSKSRTMLSSLPV